MKLISPLKGIALWGMPVLSGGPGVITIVIPPAARMAASPRDPSSSEKRVNRAVAVGELVNRAVQHNHNYWQSRRKAVQQPANIAEPTMPRSFDCNEDVAWGDRHPVLPTSEDKASGGFALS